MTFIYLHKSGCRTGRCRLKDSSKYESNQGLEPFFAPMLERCGHSGTLSLITIIADHNI